MALSPEAIAFACDEAAEKDLRNTAFVAIDVSDFDATAPSAAFDFTTTFDAIHLMFKGLFSWLENFPEE